MFSAALGLPEQSVSDAAVSCVKPPSTFLQLAAGCPATTAPDTDDCRISDCTQGVLLEPMVVEVASQKGAPLGANAVEGRVSVSSVALINASESRPNVGRNWVWGAQQLAHCSTTEPLPAGSLVGGLVSPPSGDIATSSPSREALDKVDWVPSWS